MPIFVHKKALTASRHNDKKTTLYLFIALPFYRLMGIVFVSMKVVTRCSSCGGI
jgi:hypothetical protein